MNYHWKNYADADTYIIDAEAYLEKAEQVIYNRGWEMWYILRAKLKGEIEEKEEVSADMESSDDDEVCLPQPEDKEGGIDLGWKEGERTWVRNHWEYKDGCSPLEKCIEITHDLSRAMDLCHQWRIENFTDEEIGYVCTNNKYEEELEAERDAWRTISYAERYLIREGFLSPENAVTDQEDQQ